MQMNSPETEGSSDARSTWNRPILRPRSRATLMAAVLTAILALAEFGVLVPGATLGVRCEMRVGEEAVQAPQI
jgi:hypothetical protein